MPLIEYEIDDGIGVLVQPRSTQCKDHFSQVWDIRLLNGIVEDCINSDGSSALIPFVK